MWNSPTNWGCSGGHLNLLPQLAHSVDESHSVGTGTGVPTYLARLKNQGEESVFLPSA